MYIFKGDWPPGKPGAHRSFEGGACVATAKFGGDDWTAAQLPVAS